ncbi:MAG: hypothetical protein M3Y69_09230, partial [Verrucomicrobiota bacterium]|nr:hypothetical protein [Verrucomicrobiota bacterium]
MKRAVVAALCMFAAAVAAPKAQTAGPDAFRALHNFVHIGAPASLVQATDGSFYGTTELRQIFRVTSTGSLTTWQPFKADVSTAAIELVAGSAGNLFGLVRTNDGQAYFFQLSGSSGEVTILHQFTAEEGSYPNGLIAADDGFIYGLIGPANVDSRGALFRLTPTGAFSTVHTFTLEENTGYSSPGSLVQGTDGNLYFVASYGGSGGYGAMFRCTRAGVLTMVYSFGGGVDGSAPVFLTQASDRSLYVVHRAGGGGSQPEALSRLSAGVLTEVHRFSTSEEPSRLATGAGGVIYGINSGYSHASVFRFDPVAGFTTLHQFAPGERVNSSLILSNSVLYGIASNTADGFGFVFRLPVVGGLTRFCEFNDAPAPFAPNGGLVQAPDGTFYGTTKSGGAAGKGTVYKLQPDGAFAILYAFDSPSDGSQPASLVVGGDGVLYGTTAASNGGSSTMFRLTTSGVFTTIDVSPTTPLNPGYHTLISGRDGAIYGTTGGDDRGSGYVFKIAADGTVAKLYEFTGGADGGRPLSLVHATDGNLYGLTSVGGANRAGTLFRLSPLGSFTTIRNFEFGVFSPRLPLALVQGSDGNLYC